MRLVKVRKGQKLAGFPALPYLLSRVDNCPTTLLSVDNLSERSHKALNSTLHSRQQSRFTISITFTVSARTLINTLLIQYADRNCSRRQDGDSSRSGRT